MPSIDIDPLNISTEILMLIYEIDNKKISTKQHNEWEVYDEKKMGYLNKLGDWSNVTLEIVGEIDDPRANKAFATIHCRWTNRTSFIELKLDAKSDNDKKVFINTTQIFRSDYSSKVVVIVKFLKDSLKMAIQKNSPCLLTMRTPEIDRGCFILKMHTFKKMELD